MFKKTSSVCLFYVLLVARMRQNLMLKTQWIKTLKA